jgi:sterol 3beta-glucosyltransferase
VGFLADARSVANRRLADAAAACEGADAIVANNLAQLLGWQMADRFQLPLVRVLFHPPNYWMARGSGGPVRTAARQLVWLAARPWLNSVRRDSLGLAPLPLREPLAGLDRRRLPVLYPVSPAVFPVPAGAGEAASATGYWFLDGSLDPDPPAEIAAFLQSGPAPVYVGFGTNIDESLRRAGCRGVLACPPDALGAAAAGDDIFAVDAIAHRWLFPRCAAVVHHAAAGTTAAGLHAGVPTVPVPHHSDQFAWARRIHELGVACAPIPRRTLTAAGLGEAIRAVTSDEVMRARASALGTTIRAEDGVTRAVEHFERWVRPPAARTPSAPVAGAGARGGVR